MPFLFVLCTGTLVITTIIGHTKTALVITCIMLISLIVYFVFVWKRALPSYEIYSKFKRSINGKNIVNFQTNHILDALNKLCEVVFHAKIDVHSKQKISQKVADIPTKKTNVTVFNNEIST